MTNTISIDLSEEALEAIKSALSDVVEDALSKKSLTGDDSPEYMNLKEASQQIGVSYNTLKKYIQDYGLKVSMVGCKKFISSSELNRFMKEYEI